MVNGKTPWEQLDEQSSISNPEDVLGQPQEGFSPVPAAEGDDGDSAQASTVPETSAAAAGAGPHPISAAAAAGGEIDQLIAKAGAGVDPRRRPQRRPRGRAAGQTSAPGQAVLDANWAATAEPGAVAEVAPINVASSAAPNAGWDSTPPLSAYVDHTSTDVPLPPAPPPEDPTGPPPPEDEPPASSVAPITGH